MNIEAIIRDEQDRLDRLYADHDTAEFTRDLEAYVRDRRRPGVPAADELLRLCEHVLRSDQVDTLTDFATGYDDAGARTFGCLLYSLNRRAGAVFWWRFAAGAGDELAAHCLAVHHAAAGPGTDARLWRWIARAMGFRPERHIPPIRRATAARAHGLGQRVAHGTPLLGFLHQGAEIREFLAEGGLADE